MHFPRLVIPLSTVLTAAFNMMREPGSPCSCSCSPTASTRVPRGCCFPLIVLLFVTFTAGVAMLLSALYVRYRDVSADLGRAVDDLLFYGSPVLYPIEAVPEDWRAVVLGNPLAALLETARVAVVDASAPTVAEAAGSELAWLLPTAVSRGRVRARLLGLQPRGAADRRGALAGRTLASCFVMARQTCSI